MGGDCLNQKRAMTFGIEQDNVRQLAMFRNRDAQTGQLIKIAYHAFLCGVTKGKEF